MFRFLRTYWLELVLLAVVSAYYIGGVVPDMTWMSLGGDQPNYVIAAKNFSPAGLVGYPLFVMLGWLFERLPFNDFWNLALLSVMSTLVTCVFIYLTSRLLSERFNPSITKKYSRFVGITAALMYAGAFIVWTQSVIPEVYTLSALLAVVATYFTLRGRYYISAIFCALSLGVHPLNIFVIVCNLVYVYFDKKDFKFLVRLGVIMSSGLLFYLQYYFTRDPSASPFFLDGPVMQCLRASNGFFTLPIYPFSTFTNRIGEVASMLLVSVGLPLLLLPFIPFRRKEVWLVLSCGFITFVAYAFSFYPQWVTYLVWPVAFLCVLAGVAVSRLKISNWAMAAIVTVPFMMVIANADAYDIGKSVDPFPTTARQFYNSLDQLPDNSLVLLHTWGHAGVLCYYYVAENGNRISFINYNTISEEQNYPNYIPYQEARGIHVPYFPHKAVALRLYGVSDYARAVQLANPSKSVYVAYLKEGSAPMKFDVALASDYTASLNDLQPAKTIYGGR